MYSFKSIFCSPSPQSPFFFCLLSSSISHVEYSWSCNLHCRLLKEAKHTKVTAIHLRSSRVGRKWMRKKLIRRDGATRKARDERKWIIGDKNCGTLNQTGWKHLLSYLNVNCSVFELVFMWMPNATVLPSRTGLGGTRTSTFSSKCNLSPLAETVPMLISTDPAFCMSWRPPSSMVVHCPPSPALRPKTAPALEIGALHGSLTTEGHSWRAPSMAIIE